MTQESIDKLEQLYRKAVGRRQDSAWAAVADALREMLAENNRLRSEIHYLKDELWAVCCGKEATK